MGTLIALVFLVFCVLCLCLLWLDSWLVYRDIQRWERRQKYRDGGYDRPNAYTNMSQPIGTLYETGKEDIPETTEECKLTLVRGPLFPPTGYHETPHMRLVNSSSPWLTKSGKPTGISGEDSGPILPGNAA